MAVSSRRVAHVPGRGERIKTAVLQGQAEPGSETADRQLIDLCWSNVASWSWNFQVENVPAQPGHQVHHSCGRHGLLRPGVLLAREEPMRGVVQVPLQLGAHLNCHRNGREPAQIVNGFLQHRKSGAVLLVGGDGGGWHGGAIR